MQRNFINITKLLGITSKSRLVSTVCDLFRLFVLDQRPYPDCDMNFTRKNLPNPHKGDQSIDLLPKLHLYIFI